MALNWVASEDGLEDNPKILSMARALKVPRALAYWYVMRWRRFILNYSTNLEAGTIPKIHTADDVAAFLEFKGPAKRLVDELRRGGFLATRRGGGFCYPGWADTVTGHYVLKRAGDARRKEETREAARRAREGGGDEQRSSGKPEDGPHPVRGQAVDASADSPRPVHGETDIKKESPSEDGRAGPPDPPLQGGADRWRWLLENAPRPQNPSACIPILDRMPPDEWALVQRAYGTLTEVSPGGGSIYLRRKKALEAPTDVFLRKGAHWQFVERKPATAKRVKRPAEAPKEDPAAVVARERAQAVSLLLDRLADPDVPESKKERLRAEWTANHGDAPWLEPPPAELAAQEGGAHAPS